MIGSGRHSLSGLLIFRLLASTRFHRRQASSAVVDEAALLNALRKNRLAAAAVDVFSTEPADTDNPLLAAASSLSGRLLLTPHVAGITRQAWAKLFSLAWENVEAVAIRGEKPKFIS